MTDELFPFAHFMVKKEKPRQSRAFLSFSWCQKQ